LEYDGDVENTFFYTFQVSWWISKRAYAKSSIFDWLATNADVISTQSHSCFGCSREQGEKQFDWLAKITDVISTQSHSCFAYSREKNHHVDCISPPKK
jgi:hypothetical protein